MSKKKPNKPKKAVKKPVKKVVKVKAKSSKPAKKAVAGKSKKVSTAKPIKKAKPVAVKKSIKPKKVEKVVVVKAKQEPVKKIISEKNTKQISQSPVALKQKAKEKSPVQVETAPPAPPKKVVKTFFSSSSEKSSKKSQAPHPNQFSIEYIMHASPYLLFEVISSPSGLSEWFADDVNIRDGNFTFFWDGSSQTAKLIAYKQDKFVRFRWLDKPEYTFFEFRIEIDELTNDTSLIITDFADEGDKDAGKLLWDNQIGVLKKVIGS